MNSNEFTNGKTENRNWKSETRGTQTTNANQNFSAPKIPTVGGKKLTKINAQQNIPGNYSTASDLNIQVGMEVKHQRFGSGKVIQLEGGYPNQKATVFFPSTGQKQLLLRFAKLEVVS